MTPGEVVARAHRTAIHRWDALLYRGTKAWWRREWTPRAGDLVLRRAPDAPRGFLTADRACLVRDRAPEAAKALVAEAVDVVGGRYRYFGYPAVNLPQEVDFARDPFSTRSWPAQHGKRIDYRQAAYGDPKWVWELNRLQELPLLVAASLLAEDDVYSRRAVALALRWIATTEPGRGIAWSNGFEAGMRAISLALFLDALRGSALLDRSDAEQIAVSLWQHARGIQRDPSTHSSANNHRIGELAGLVVIGLLVPELREAEALLEHSLADLAREAERQIAPDGTSVEQAFRYHLFVLDHLLLVVALLDAAGHACPAAITDALRRSGRALAAQLGDADPEPTYGDCDDAMVVRLAGTELRRARGVAAGIAARLGDPHARAAARELDAMAFWLFGGDGAERFAATEPAPAPGSTVLGDAGIVILRARRRRVMLDAGPLGYLATAAHGHADALQVTLSEDGEDLVVDPGVGSYFGNSDVRAALRGTAAHATVTVDGVDQSEPGGSFLWTRHASGRLVALDVENCAAVAEHDGYIALSDPVAHRRLVRASGDGPIVVIDRLASAGAHEVTQSWPLHPSLEASSDGDVARVTRDGRPRLLIALHGTVRGRLQLLRGERAPLRGWYSRRLEHLEPAWLVSWSATTVGPVDIVALLWPLEGRTWPEPSLEVERGPGLLRIRFRGSEGAVELSVDDRLELQNLSP